MKKYLSAAVITFLIIFSGSSCLADDKAQKQSPELSGKIENGVRVIEVTASRYKFEPDPIVVKLGERVRIVAKTTDISHGLAIPEFKVNLTIDPGKTATVAFVADKAGDFSAYCSIYCGPGHAEMRGKFIVIK